MRLSIILLRKFFRIAVFLTILAAWNQAASAQVIVVRGLIFDRSDGQPLLGANVVLRDLKREWAQLLGASTDKDGFYQISQIPAGTYALRISFVGYAAYTDTLSLGQALFVTISVELEPVAQQLDEVVIAGEGGAARIRAGLQTVRPADLRRIPTPDASGDLATYLQTLPGVVSIGDRGGQLFIRGGTPSQNLVLLDGVLIYQPMHILGFFSAFPEDLISFVDVYAGGYGARYSGRISSVIDVSTRDGNRQFFEGSGSISPFLTSFRIEGPLRKGRISVLASVRRSMIEGLASTLYGRSLPFQFGDLFIKVQRTDGISSKCSASLMSTYDRGRIEAEGEHSDDVFQWNNVVVGARCLVFPTNAPYLFEISTGLSYVDSDVGNENLPERTSDALQFGVDMHLKRLIGSAQLNFGSFVRMTWLGLQLREQFLNIAPQEDLLFSTGAYAETELSPSEYLTITPGLALVLHPEDYPISIEPRLRAVWKPGGKDGADEISGAIGLYKQTLVGVTDERDAGSAFVAWMTAPVKTTQSEAVHGLISWQRPVGRRIRFATEAYYKRMTDLPIPTWSSVASFTTTLALASGESYGLDGRLEVFGENIYGYVGYGYSETLYFASEDNFGLWYGESVQEFHPPHDRRHQLNVVFSLELGRFRASARWQYGSGLPFTQPYGFDEIISLRDFADVRRSPGTTRLLYDKPYQARLPAYHRLDLSVERVFDVGEGSIAFQVGAINVYDRANLFYFDLFTIRRVDQLPFLPTLSIKYDSNR